MSRYSMLSLDLSTTDEKRKKFYEELEKKKWIKMEQLSTVWYCSWKDGTKNEVIIQGAKTDIADAAKVAGIPVADYWAGILVGDHIPETF